MSLAAAYFLGSTPAGRPAARGERGRDPRVDEAREQTLADLVDDEIDALGSAKSAFAPDMEARYDTDLLPRRRSYLRSLLTIVLIAQTLVLAVQSLIEDLSYIGHLVEFAVVTPWIVLCRYGMGRARSVAVLDGLVVSCVVVQLLVATVSALGPWREALPPGALHVSLHLVIILAACSLLRLPQRAARRLLVGGFGVCVLVLSACDLAFEDQVLGILQMLMVMLAALGANAQMERADRGSYLMRVRAALQLERMEVDKAAFERIAQLDPLTGVANRRVFDMKLETFLRAARFDAPFLLALIDVDHFKAFNDIEGHVAGDEALRRVAAALRAHAGAGLVARYGGEEFAVLMPDLSPHDMAGALEGLRKGVASLALRHPGRPDHLDRLTVSVGAAMSTGGDGARPLIDQADAALYRAKKAGRNCVEFGSGAQMSRDIAGTSGLRRFKQIAAAAGPIVWSDGSVFSLHPIEDEAACVVGYAVEDPGWPEAAPLAFARDRSACDEMADPVHFQAIFAHAAGWSEPLSLVLPLPASVWTRPDMAERILTAARLAAWDARQLHLELLPPSSGGLDLGKLDGLVRLREAGVGLILGRFGQGCANLDCLGTLPLTGVAVDLSTISADAAPAELRRVTIAASLARSLGLSVTATGIRTPSHHAAARAAGATRFRGQLLLRIPASQDDPYQACEAQAV